MGLTLVWVAVRKSAGAALLQALDLERAGDCSDELRSPYCCAETAEGWLVLALARDDRALEQAVSRTPAGGEIRAFEMNETVMFSRARAVRDGRLVWSVTHDPDRDLDGVQVEGDAPSQLDTILRRRQAEQAANTDQDTDYVFDVPLDLSEAVCGYTPRTDIGLEWSIVQKRSEARAAGLSHPQRSLREGMRTELLPLLRSLGWDVQGDKPKLSSPGDIFRRVGDTKQLIWFDYAQGMETYIVSRFATVDESGPDGWFSMVGRVAEPAPPPWWKRFSLKRSKVASDALPSSDAPSVLERARREILIADTFLKTGETSGRIQARYRRQPPPTAGPT